MSTMRVFVTGADGFIGSHVTEALVRRGHTVRALVWYNAFGHHGWLDELAAEVRESIDIVAGDIRDGHAMIRLAVDCDAIVHLAALVGVPYSFESPESYVQTNVRGTLNVLQAARQAGVRRFVQVSTSEVYGTAERVPMDESHPLKAQSPYAATKTAADQMALSYYRSFGLPVVVVRPFNTYGPRQSARAVIPTIITQLAAGREEIRLGSLAPRRDLTFVTDTAAGLAAAVEADDVAGEVINLGTGEDIAVGELVERIAALMQVSVRCLCDPDRLRPESSEVERLVADNGKAERLLHWRPEVSLDNGLRRTIEWFRMPRSLSCYHPDRYTV